MTQRTKFKIVVYCLLFVIACLLLFWFSSFMSAKSRDYGRLSDLKVMQGKMTSYYYKFNTYKIPGCSDNSLVSSCVDQIDFKGIADPIDSGIYRYIIYSLSDTEYKIGFSLETKMGGLNAGEHIYGKDGVIQ